MKPKTKIITQYCSHVFSITYACKQWLIIFTDGQAFGAAPTVASVRCPHCPAPVRLSLSNFT